MSEELIKKSDAIEAIELVDWYHQNRNKDIVSGANSREHQAWYKAEDIYKALEAVPATKPKRGKWIGKAVFHNKADEPFVEKWQSTMCSVCHKYHTTPYIHYFNNYNFCPNCGADMRGTDDEL